MFRQFAILLCIAVIVCAGPYPTVAPAVNNLASKSSDPASASEKNKDNSGVPSGFVAASKPKTVAEALGVPLAAQDNALSSSENSFEGPQRRPASTYLPSKTVSYEMNTADVKTIAAAMPVESQAVKQESTGESSASQAQASVYAAATASDAIDSRAQSVYTPNPVPEKPYYASPVAAKTITIASHLAVGDQQPASYRTQNGGPSVTYSTDFSPFRRQYITVETREDQNTLPSAQSLYPGNNVQTVAVPQGTQYVSSPRLTYAVKHAVSSVPAPKSVTVETFNSFRAQPPPAPKYVAAPALIKYAPATLAVQSPIPVPVLFETPAVQTHHPSLQQFFVAKHQPISVPVISQAPLVQYHAPVPVVHAKSFVENVFAPVGAPRNVITPIAIGHRVEGYTKADSFSPASTVSRVTFNGLGVSYGW